MIISWQKMEDLTSLMSQMFLKYQLFDILKQWWEYFSAEQFPLTAQHFVLGSDLTAFLPPVFQEPDPARAVQLLLHPVAPGHHPEEEAQPALGGSGGPSHTRSAARLLLGRILIF